ncbi:membrane protein [Mycobacterium phage Aminay]|uniref:Membrane protein n=1 Tax=Mycobacterium phage Aminay TaxID=2250291 RepID=A0A345KV20_9CAUD|nr:membrane protein [Mycobacterium phage Aminay]AXH46872.1 membrane protein [Mycobacterium phage Aminay]
MNTQLIVNLLLASGTLATALLGVMSYRQNRRKGDADIEHSQATTTEVVNRAAQINETREMEREKFWRSTLADTERRLEGELSNVRAELANLKNGINKHVSWDFKAIRELRLLGSDIEDPPSLLYVPDDDERK